MSKICFPHMGNYHIAVKYLLNHITKLEVLDTPKITNKTIMLGTKYSPDFVCTPFKYTLGNYIEALELGADVLIQLGGGCRYGYYCELQETILKDLGYDFTYINLISAGKTDLKKIYHHFKQIDPSISFIKASYYGIITIQIIKYMDKIDDYIRKNIGFEVKKNSFRQLNNQFLKDIVKVKTPLGPKRVYNKYLKKFKNIAVNKPNNCLKVGIIGELYTVMEPFANYYLETQLANFNIEVTRYTNAYYLMIEKTKKIKKYLKNTPFIKYKMGADAADNIARALYLCEHNYDGIIHIKSSFCTPEIGAMPVINKICNIYETPVMFFSFDASTSEVGIRTRLEAFNDMIEMRKKND